MLQANEITICRHAAQKILHWAQAASPRPCQGLLAGHGCHIDDAQLLALEPGQPDAEVVDAAVEALRRQGLGIIGWFHSRADGHEPDAPMMAALEHIVISEPRPTEPVHLLVALDMKGRMDLHAYVRNHAERPDRAPLRLLDDTPLYLRTPRR
jgi:hypothetical protein